jgi:Tfp pilus assembly protein PilN
MGLYYYQQTTVAEAMNNTLGENTRNLAGLAPKIGALATDQDKIRQTLKSAIDLGVQHDAWAQILAVLNDKIPEGVWITELIPVSNPAPGAAPSPHSGTAADFPTGQVNMLLISGLYHANPKTQMVNYDRLEDFVKALADLPYFDIDKNNVTTTLPNYGGEPNAFAQKFSMRLKLKTPIILKPDVSKPGTGKPGTGKP